MTSFLTKEMVVSNVPLEPKNWIKPLNHAAQQELLDQMSPAVREIVRKDSIFRLTSVLATVRDNKYQKQVAIGRLHSVLTQSIPKLVERDQRRESGWGSW